MIDRTPEYRYMIWTTAEAAREIGCSEDAIIQAMGGFSWGKLTPYGLSNDAGYLWDPRDIMTWWGYVCSARGPGAEAMQVKKGSGS